MPQALRMPAIVSNSSPELPRTSAPAVAATSFLPWAWTVFDGHLRGLVLAEAECATDDEAQSFAPPVACVAEVTDDARFTGGRLVRASRRELLSRPAEYGLRPEGP
ncbi:hypothetical protein [Streptomyces sp. AF1A]|jgi:hypothetical protein|uniref:hypothetical protein n=1 Tax=Streptomyces sp. AF1A TaxID=3394350 RepID=UPI0039BC9BAD